MFDNPAFLPADHPRVPEVRDLDAAFMAVHHDRITRAVECFLASGRDPTQFALVIDVPPKGLVPPGRVQIHAVARAFVRAGVEQEFAPMCDVIEHQAPLEGSMWLLLKMPDHATVGSVCASSRAQA
jgi:hypothetical protein